VDPSVAIHHHLRGHGPDLEQGDPGLSLFVRQHGQAGGERRKHELLGTVASSIDRFPEILAGGRSGRDDTYFGFESRRLHAARILDSRLPVNQIVLGYGVKQLAVLGDRDRPRHFVHPLEIGAVAAEMMVYRDGRIHVVATFPWGGLTVTNDIVKGLGIPLADAEDLKRDRGSASTRGVGGDEQLEIPGPTPGRTREVSRELLAHIIEQRLDEMFGLVYEALEEKQMLDVLPGGVVLTGGGSSLQGIVELAQTVFNMPVALGQPGAGLEGLVEATRDPSLSAAAGLALYGRMRTQETGGGLALRTVSRLTDWLRDFF
jgi:cell division protein FtsA